MLGRIKSRKARMPLSLELLEDRRLLSASLLGAAAPVLAAPPPVAPAQVAAAPLANLAATVGNAAAQITTVPVALSSAVGMLDKVLPPAAPVVELEVAVVDVVQKAVDQVSAPVQPAAVIAGLEASLSSPAPAVVPDIQVAAQVAVGANQAPADQGVQLQVGPVAASVPAPGSPPAVSVNITADTAQPAPSPISAVMHTVTSIGAVPMQPVNTLAAAVLSNAASQSATPVAGAVNVPNLAATSDLLLNPRTIDALFRNIGGAGLQAGATTNSLIPQLLASPAQLALPTSGSSQGMEAAAPQSGLPLAAEPREVLPGLLEEVRRDENEASPRLLDLLAEVNPSAVAGLEQAATQILAQFRALQQQFGDFLAGLGLYHWLLSLALGAAACSLYLRQQRRKAAAAGERDAALLGAPQFAFLAGDRV